MSDNNFYIGYRKHTHSSVKHFYRKLVLGIMSVAMITLTTIIYFSTPPNYGIFEFGIEQEFSGIIKEKPYPMLIVERPHINAKSQYMLTIFGKYGADDIIKNMHGEHVKITGSLIYRDGHTMIEAHHIAKTNKSNTSDIIKPYKEVDLGYQTIEGQVVDSKCYLGVMKPGELKAHKACAINCISGGVPPILINSNHGNIEYYLLESSKGDLLNKALVERDLIAQPVRVSGKIIKRGDIYVIQADIENYQKVFNTNF